MPPKKMIVHGPDDFPQDMAVVKSLPADREILMAVTPTSGYCTKAVRTLSPRQRECVFESEKKLNYFPVYSETNCIQECRIDLTAYYCNCSHFYYHHTGKQPAALYYLLDLVHPHLIYVRFNRPNFETCLFHKYQNCVLKLYTQYSSKVLKRNFTGCWRELLHFPVILIPYIYKHTCFISFTTCFSIHVPYLAQLVFYLKIHLKCGQFWVFRYISQAKGIQV